MKDGHIHSPYCPHGSKDTFDEYVKRAISQGLTEITFTEHLPLPKNFEDPSPKADSAMQESLLLDYFNDVRSIKDKYKGKIKINVGVEVDFIEGYEEEIKSKLDKYSDYIEDSILSCHILKIEEKYFCIDFSVDEFKKIIDLLGGIENVYNKYYETLKLAINSELGKSKPKRLGHLNLVRKYNQVYPYDYTGNEILEDVIKLAKEKNYELDFNISGIRKAYCKEAYIHGYLLDLVKKYKLPTVLGSDSHESGNITAKIII